MWKRVGWRERNTSGQRREEKVGERFTKNKINCRVEGSWGRKRDASRSKKVGARKYF